MPRKGLSIILAVVFLMSFTLLAGCGGQTAETEKPTTQATQATTAAQTTATEPAKPALEGKTVTFATFTQWYNTIAGLKGGLAKCEELTGAKIQINVYPDAQFKEVLNTKLAAGEVEDFFAYYGSANAIVAKDRLEPLDGPWIQTTRKDTLKAATRETDNKVVAAPYGTSDCIAVIYNKKVMEKANVKLPLNNYNDLMAACEVIKKTGVAPIFLPNADLWTAQIFAILSYNNIYSKDPTITEKMMKNQTRFEKEPAIVELGNRIAKLKDQGYLNSDYQSANFNMALEAVATGKAGMFFGGSWLYADVNTKYPDNAADVGMMPGTFTDEQSYFVAPAVANSFYVSSDSKNKEAAKTIINTFLSEDVLKVVAKDFTSFPVNSAFNNEMNSWVKELKGFQDAGIPCEDQYTKFFSADFALGAAGACWQSVFAGKDVIAALTDLSNDQIAQNKAKERPGF